VPDRHTPQFDQCVGLGLAAFHLLPDPVEPREAGGVCRPGDRSAASCRRVVADRSRAISVWSVRAASVRRTRIASSCRRRRAPVDWSLAN